MATRGLQKSDSSIEYRYKATTDNSSQVEYFRDVLGDSADFEEDVEGTTCTGSFSCSASNGLLIGTGLSGTTGGVYFSSISVTPLIYTSADITFKFDSSSTGSLQIWDSAVSESYSSASAFTGGTAYQTVTISLDAASWSNADKTSFYFRFTSLTSGDSIYVKEVHIYGDLDYATHENSIGDTWDWEDSQEFWYDVEGNVSDFNDGTIEDWQPTTDDTNLVMENVGNEYLNLTRPSNIKFFGFNLTNAVSITASTYKYLAIEMNTTYEITSIEIKDTYAGNSVCLDGTNHAGGSWFLFTCTLSSDPDWTGTETDLDIEISFTDFHTDHQVFINMIYLYDTSLGDLESITNACTADYDQYVNPIGYNQLFWHTNSSSANCIATPNTLTIDTSIFDTLIIKVKGAINYRMYGTQQTAARLFNDIVFDGSFNTYTIDLSADSDWTGTVTRFIFYFKDPSGNNYIAPETLIQFDYILLEASTEQQQDFTVGFYDQDSSTADLFNLTHHFWNSSYFRWELELYDSSQAVASYYYSANYSVSDVYYEIKLSYSILESQLVVEMKQNDGTRIFKVDWTDDFTTSATPILFAFKKAPDLYISTYTVFYGSQEVWIDYIKASFKENEWKHSYASTDSDWLHATPYNSYVQDNIGDWDNYTLTVPSLDAVSGSLQINLTDLTALGASLEQWYAIIGFYAVDALTGELVHLVSGQLGMQNFATDTTFSRLLDDTWTQQQYYQILALQGSPTFDFSFATRNDRNSFDFQGLSDMSPGVNKYQQLYASTGNISDLVTNPSDEFVIEISYYANFTDDLEVYFSLDNFQFIQRNIFEDVQNFLGDVIGRGADVAGNPLADLARMIVGPIVNAFAILIRWLADILNTAFGVIIGSLGVLLATAINALQPLLTAISTAVGLVTNAVNSAITAIGNIAAGIWSAFVTAVSDFVNALGGVIEDIVDFITGVASYLLDALLDLMPFGIGAIVRSFNNLSITDVVNTIVDAFNFLLSLWSFITFMLLIFLGLYMTVPLLKATDPDKVGDAFGGLLHNAFNLHGFDLNTGLGNLTIPIRINAFALWLILAVLGGYLALIFPITLF